MAGMTADIAIATIMIVVDMTTDMRTTYNGTTNRIG
jgi:hypothetical protein